VDPDPVRRQQPAAPGDEVLDYFRLLGGQLVFGNVLDANGFGHCCGLQDCSVQTRPQPAWKRIAVAEKWGEARARAARISRTLLKLDNTLGGVRWATGQTHFHRQRRAPDRPLSARVRQFKSRSWSDPAFRHRRATAHFQGNSPRRRSPTGFEDRRCGHVDERKADRSRVLLAP
jgi:hypothetical protein